MLNWGYSGWQMVCGMTSQGCFMVIQPLGGPGCPPNSQNQSYSGWTKSISHHLRPCQRPPTIISTMVSKWCESEFGFGSSDFATIHSMDGSPVFFPFDPPGSRLRGLGAKRKRQVLCGTPASASADFREQGSALRRGTFAFGHGQR